MTTLTEAYRAARTQRRPRPARTPVLVLLGRLLVMLGTLLGRRVPSWSQVRTTVLTVGGLGLVTVGAWNWSHPVGFAVAGASLLVVEMLSGSDR